jgi:outer membrane lipoprotein LolB
MLKIIKYSLNNGLYIGFILSVFFLEGCTNNPLKTSQQLESVHKIETTQFPITDNWTIYGRISVINDEENWYAKFIWIQKQKDFQLSFIGPLGETELQVSQMGQKVYLESTSGIRSGDDLEQLIWQETGWKLPLNSLSYWSKGLSNPNIKARLKYNKQQISDIFQAGWHIQYPKRMLLDSVLVPKKIIATKEDIKIKLIITQWLIRQDSIEFNE